MATELNVSDLVDNAECAHRSDIDGEEEIEPKLKYERITCDLTSILDHDAASCIAVHTKFLALGTHWGMIFIIDHFGNKIQDKEIMATSTLRSTTDNLDEILKGILEKQCKRKKSYIMEWKQLSTVGCFIFCLCCQHSTTVNQISIDRKGEYLASCSDDGKVIIAGLYSSEHNQTVSFDRPVKSVGIDPAFSDHGRGAKIVVGEEKLVMIEKSGFFRTNKLTTLHNGEGLVREIKWRGKFLAWSNDTGVRVWDTNSRCLITRVKKDHSYRPDLYGCHLAWKDDRTFLVGWAVTVKVCAVKEHQRQDLHDFPKHYVEIVAMFQTDFHVCGIAPMDDNVIVFSYSLSNPQEEGDNAVCKRPQLQILEPGFGTYEDITSDALSIRGFEEYRVTDYLLESIVEESLYFLVSPKDVVVARVRDMDDHISYLIENKRYEEAMSCASIYEKELRSHCHVDIGRAYLDFLLDECRYSDAVNMFPTILGKRKDLWEEEIYKFARIGKLRVISPCIPISDPVLSPTIYEMVLYDFLHSDYVQFYQLIRAWPPELYNKEVMVISVLDCLDMDPNAEILLQSLGQLYTYQKAFDKALSVYLRLGNKDVFTMIEKHSLFNALSDHIRPLMGLDSQQTTRLLLLNKEIVPVQRVIDQLILLPDSTFLYVYLDQLFQRDSTAANSHTTLMIDLYAEHDRPRLMFFLRHNKCYPLNHALDVCLCRRFFKEQVYLLGRMGNQTKALDVIMEELGDVNQAIEFCKEQNDEELWEDLISHSVKQPRFITALLNNVGSDIDPIRIINQMQDELCIPGLRDSLVKIMQDYTLQVSLQEGCRKILVADGFNLLRRMITTQRRAIYVDDTRLACNLTVFYCHHVFHEGCLPVDMMLRHLQWSEGQPQYSRSIYVTRSITTMPLTSRVQAVFNRPISANALPQSPWTSQQNRP